MNVQAEHAILVAMTVGMMGIVFWAVRSMVNKLDERVDSLEEVMTKEFTHCHLNRREILKELMTKESHVLVCRATQAEFKLHVSNTAKKNREYMAAMIEDLKKSLKDNNSLK